MCLQVHQWHEVYVGNYYVFCFLFICFVNLSQTRVVGKKWTLIEKLPPSDWPVDKSGGHLLDFSVQKSPATVGDATLGQVVLVCIRKIAKYEEIKASKHLSSKISTLVSASKYFICLSSYLDFPQ